MQRFLAKQIGQPGYDVFINYRRIDTGKTFVPLLYDHLMYMGVKPFWDTIHMKPDTKVMIGNIGNAIKSSKIGVAVLSPSFCDSYFSLHQLALLNKSNKRIVPIFFDIKPSQLEVKDNASYPSQALQTFRDALEETKYTVGITFDSLNGDWLELRKKTSDAVIMNLLEVEEEENRQPPDI